MEPSSKKAGQKGIGGREQGSLVHEIFLKSLNYCLLLAV